jgi:hypothetical protein
MAEAPPKVSNHIKLCPVSPICEEYPGRRFGLCELHAVNRLSTIVFFSGVLIGTPSFMVPSLFRAHLMRDLFNAEAHLPLWSASLGR